MSQREQMAKDNELLYGMLQDGTSVFIHITNTENEMKADFVTQYENMQCGGAVDVPINSEGLSEFVELHPMDNEEKKLFAKLLTDVKSIDEIGYAETQTIKDNLGDSLNFKPQRTVLKNALYNEIDYTFNDEVKNWVSAEHSSELKKGRHKNNWLKLWEKKYGSLPLLLRKQAKM